MTAVSQQSGFPSEWLQYPKGMNFGQFILDCQHPLRPKEEPSIIQAQNGRKITFDELRSRTFALAAALRSTFGIGEDDVVMLCSTNHADYAIVIWAVHMLGGAVTLSNPIYTANELAHQAKLTKATLLIYHSAVSKTISANRDQLGLPRDRFISIDGTEPRSVGDLIGRAEHLKQPVSPFKGGDRVAILALSSGTTGAPKAVKVTHHGLIMNILQAVAHSELAKLHTHSPGDVLLPFLPFFHIAGLVTGLHLSLFCGCTVVIAEHFDFARNLQDVPKYGVTTLGLVPPQAIGLAKHPKARSFTTVTKMVIGAAPVSEDLLKLIKDVLPNVKVWNLYGLTEVSGTAAVASIHSPPGSAGKLLPGIEYRVVDLDGTPVKAGEKGELYIKTPSVSPGYLDNEEATRESFTDDGWVRTGDEVYFTEGKDMFVLDRIKDFLKVRGYQVAPAELEGCLLGHPDVSDAGVIGIPHDYSGQVPIAYVVLQETAKQRIQKGSANESEIRTSILQFVSQKLAPYKKLHGVEFVPAIPKTPSGKILRRLIKQAWNDAQKPKL